MSVSQAELPALSEHDRPIDDEAKASLRARLNAGLQTDSLFRHLLRDGLLCPRRRRCRRNLPDRKVHPQRRGLRVGDPRRIWRSAFWQIRWEGSIPPCTGPCTIHGPPSTMQRPGWSLAAVLGYFVALYGPSLLGIDQRWGVAGLAASSGVAGWLEYALLKRSLKSRIGKTGLSVSFAAQIVACRHSRGAAGGMGSEAGRERPTPDHYRV